jgi:hypothetical protein
MFSKLFGKSDPLGGAEAALSERGWKFSRLDADFIVTGFAISGAKVLIQIRNEPRKRALLILANPLVGNLDPIAALQAGTLPFLRIHAAAGHSSEQVARACEHLLRRNYEISIGAFERDPSDGETRFRVALPYRDALATQEQVAWCVETTVHSMAELLSDLSDLVRSGRGMSI